jgi:hypothetical protein
VISDLELLLALRLFLCFRKLTQCLLRSSIGLEVELEFISCGGCSGIVIFIESLPFVSDSVIVLERSHGAMIVQCIRWRMRSVGGFLRLCLILCLKLLIKLWEKSPLNDQIIPFEYRRALIVFPKLNVKGCFQYLVRLNGKVVDSRLIQNYLVIDFNSSLSWIEAIDEVYLQFLPFFILCNH